MKTIVTHLLAVAIGALAMLLLRPASDTQEPEGATRGLSESITSAPTETASRIDQRQLEAVAPKEITASAPAETDSRIDWRQLEAVAPIEITASDLDQWLAGHRGDARSLAEAQAIAGLLTNNPDVIRQAIEADPKNPHLLYIGATLPSFTKEERQALGERFFMQDTQNGLAAYIYAAQLFEAGDTKTGIEILRSSPDRPRIDAFTAQTYLLMDDAYIAAGYSPSAAKILSTFNITTPYLSDLYSLATSINDLGDSMPTDEAADLRSLTALMGMRLSDQMSSNTVFDHLTGLSLEEKTLAGLPSDSPSPYEGLTVEQARQAITNERKELGQLMKQAPGLDTIMSSTPELVDSYIERLRLGEQEAVRWWLETTSGQK